MLIQKDLKIRAFGKINLYLNISKNIRIDGYHDIKSIMQSIGLSDELVYNIEENGREIDSGNPDGIYITSDDVNIPLDEKNLVHKAAAIILNEYRLKGRYRIKINIKKHIPVCAGLAGGSVNAAATLEALNRAFGLKIQYPRLLKLAALAGSDVPFCIKGGTALAEGRGERLTQLPDIPFYWLVLVTDERKLQTKDVYEMFDLVGEGVRPKHRELVKNIREKKYDAFFKNIENDFEKVVNTEDKKVCQLKSKALKLGALAAQMTGSGPTVFAVSGDLASARIIYNGLKDQTYKVFLTHTTPKSLQVI